MPPLLDDEDSDVAEPIKPALAGYGCILSYGGQAVKAVVSDPPRLKSYIKIMRFLG